MFMVVSAAMSLVNKKVCKDLELPFTILIIQSAFAVFVLGTIFSFTLHFGSKADVWVWATRVTPLYTGVLITSMLAQLYASVGLQVVIRNLGPLLSLPIEKVFNGAGSSALTDRWVWSSLLVILAGAVFYIWESFTITTNTVELLIGCLLMAVNLVLAILERVAARKLIALQPVDISKNGMVLINNLICILPFSVFLFVPGASGSESMEFTRWQERWSGATWVDYVLLCVSAVCGVAIGWTGFNAMQFVSATTMLVITNLNKVVVVTIGMLFMGDAHGALAITGVIIALGGGVAYGFAMKNVGEADARDSAKAADGGSQKPAP